MQNMNGEINKLLKDNDIIFSCILVINKKEVKKRGGNWGIGPSPKNAGGLLKTAQKLPSVVYL